MARRLSREFSELKAALGRRLSREPSKDKIIIRDIDLGTSKKERKASRDSGSLSFTGYRKMSSDSDPNCNCNGNNVDPNCNIDLNGGHVTSTKTSSADRSHNSNRKMNRSISNIKKFIPVLYDGGIPYNIQEQAKLELKETDENIQKGMAKLKNYLKKEKFPPLGDDYLMACLRGTKYDTKKAQDKLKRYCHIRYKMANDFQKLDLETVRKVIRSKMIGYLPFRDEGGRAILVSRGADYYPEICDFEDYVLVSYLVIFHLISMPITTISGIRYLCDLKARNYAQYYQYYKTLRANLSFGIALPVRLHVDTFNDSSVCYWLIGLLRPLLPTKLSKRLRIHGCDFDSLHKEIDFSILPEEYGGTMGPMSNEFMLEKFEEFFHKFKAQNSLFLKR